MLTDAQTYCTGNQQMGEKRAMQTAKTGEKSYSKYSRAIAIV